MPGHKRWRLISGGFFSQFSPSQGANKEPVFFSHSWKLLSSQLRCLIGATDTGDTDKYCLTNIAQNLDFAPWGHRNQCYIMGLLCGYLLHITKGRMIKIPPVVNLMIWQFFLLLFFAIIYAPYHTELETGYETAMQRYSSCLFCFGRVSFWQHFCLPGFGILVATSCGVFASFGWSLHAVEAMEVILV